MPKGGPARCPVVDGREWYADVGSRLRRTAAAATFRGIGHRTGTHPETVRRYFSGGRPCARFLAAFCVAYRIDPLWLLLGTDRALPGWEHADPTAPVHARVELELALAPGHIEIVRAKRLDRRRRRGRPARASGSARDRSATEQ